MRMNGTCLRAVIAAVVVSCVVGGSFLADMPPRTTYWARIDAIAAVAKGFPAPEVQAFKAELEKAVVAGSKPAPERDPSFKAVSEDELFGAFLHLITPHVVKGEIKRVTDFLKTVSDEKLILGNFLARNGGDFMTVLRLVTGKDGKYVFQQVNQAVRPGGWQGSTFDRPPGIAAPQARIH